MLIASWLALALAVGFVVRSIIPVRGRATRWVDLLLLGTMGCITGAFLRQSFRHVKGFPPLDFLSLGLGVFAAVLVSAISRTLLCPRTTNPRGGSTHRDRPHAA